MKKQFTSFFIILIFGSFVITNNAYAYVDPGNAAVLLQLLISFIAGGIFFLRNSIKNLIFKIFKKKDD